MRKAAVGRICRKEGFKSGMKERVGDEKLMTISVTVKGITNISKSYTYKMAPKPAVITSLSSYVYSLLCLVTKNNTSA